MIEDCAREQRKDPELPKIALAKREEYRALAYVKGECARLAAQLRALAPEQTRGR